MPLLSHDSFITLHEASKWTGYSQDYLSQLARRGILDGKKEGKIWLISAKSLRDFTCNNEASGRGEKQEVPVKPSFKMASIFVGCSLCLALVIIISLGIFYNSDSGSRQTVADPLLTVPDTAVNIPATVSSL